MFAFLLSLALISAHAKDTSYETGVNEITLNRDPLEILLSPTPAGGLHVRVNGPTNAGRTNRRLAADFEDRVMTPDLKFRHLLAIDNRAFGTLEDGRLVEVSLALERGRTIGRHWIGRLTSAGVGGGTALIGAGSASGSGAMAAAGAALIAAGAALPFVMPSVGFALYMDWNVTVPGGDAAWTTEDVVFDKERIQDLELVRGTEHVRLSELVKSGRDCGHYLAEGSFERTR